MKTKFFISLLLTALIAVPSLAFAVDGSGLDSDVQVRSRSGFGAEVPSKGHSGLNAKVRVDEDKPEKSERGLKLGHAFQGLSVEARADLKAQLKALHEEFRIKLQALRDEFYAKVKALIASFIDVEAGAEAETESDGN